MTVCALLDSQTKIRLAVGYAFCSQKDQFNKSIGRKIALGRALRNLTPTTKETPR